MSDQRPFLDTSYAQALLNRRDQLHERAKRWLLEVRNAREVWLTDAVLIEVGNALSQIDRSAAVAFIRQCHRALNTHVVVTDADLMTRAVALYEARRDKEWGLMDCISFVVMTDQGLTRALTADHHFTQAGFHALLVD